MISLGTWTAVMVDMLGSSEKPDRGRGYRGEAAGAPRRPGLCLLGRAYFRSARTDVSDCFRGPAISTLTPSNGLASKASMNVLLALR